MPEIPRTKFNSPWTVAVIEAALNDVSSAKGSSESLTAALNAMRAEINALSGGVHLKGAVDYYSDLPASPSEGDAYTVRYQGTSGTDPLGIEYAWATYQGTPQWIPIGVDPSVFAKQTEMDVVANAGAKNFAVPFNPISATDIAVTKNSDGSYKFECTDVAENRVVRVANIGDLPTGAYTISGTTGGSSSSYMLGLYNTSATAVKYQHTNPEELYTGNVSGFSLRVRVIAGYSGTFTVYPMLRPAAITDPTFQPYAKTNRELTVLTDEDRAALVGQVDGGAKNLLQFTSASTGDRNGLTYDIQNGIVTVSGTPTDPSANSSAVLRINNTSIDAAAYCDGNHVLAGCPAGGADDKYRLYVVRGTQYNKSDYGSGVLLDATGITGIFLVIAVYPAYYTTLAQTPLVFRPMICTKAEWDISHAIVPYCPTLYELYQMVLALQSGTRSLSMQPETLTKGEEHETESREEER